jgi:hypothetical protein
MGATIGTGYISYPISMDNIPWDDPQELTLQDCTNIDGIYELVPRNGRFANYEIIRLFDPPASANRKITNKESFNQPDSISSPEDSASIEQNQLLVLHVRGKEAVKIELNKAGKIFTKETILLDPAIHAEDRQAGWECRVGCHDGEYIYRRVFSSGGSHDQGAKNRHWIEQRIKKLSNEDLELRVKDMYVGNNGKPAISADYIVVFPAYHGPISSLSELLKPK